MSDAKPTPRELFEKLLADVERVVQTPVPENSQVPAREYARVILGNLHEVHRAFGWDLDPRAEALKADTFLMKRLCEHAKGMSSWEQRFVEKHAKIVLEEKQTLSEWARGKAQEIDEDRVR